MRVATLGVAVALVGLLGIFAGNRHRQLVRAVADAHERLQALEHTLQAEREARQRACSETGAVTAPPTVAAPPLAAVREAARAAMRDALRQASKFAATQLPESHFEATADKAEHAQFLLREALAVEDAGWCSCPPPPNVTRLCRALAPSGGTWEREAASARAEVEILRYAVLEANARAADCSALELFPPGRHGASVS